MEPVRVAVVDVGANTLRLLVAVPDGRSVATVHQEKAQLGLGEEVERYGYISDLKCAEAVDVARAQTRRARRLGCERIGIPGHSPGGDRARRGRCPSTRSPGAPGFPCASPARRRKARSRGTARSPRWTSRRR